MNGRTRHIAHLHLHGPLTEQRHADVLDVLAGITPTIEAIPPDAVQLDLTGALRFFGRGPYDVLQMARMRLAALYGIETSAGLGPNRMVAAMAAAASPPGRTTHVDGGLETAAAWLRPRPVAALPGVGKATTTLLSRYGLRTIGQIADLPPATLQRILGAAPARLLAERARGHDPRPVTAHSPAERLTADRVLERDCLDPAAHHRAVLSLAEQIGIRLREAHQVCRRLTLTIRYADNAASARSPALASAALGMLGALALERARVRAYALRAEQLLPEENAHHQLTLDPGDGRARTAEAAADRARRRFGQASVTPATLAVPPGPPDRAGGLWQVTVGADLLQQSSHYLSSRRALDGLHGQVAR